MKEYRRYYNLIDIIDMHHVDIHKCTLTLENVLSERMIKYKGIGLKRNEVKWNETGRNKTKWNNTRRNETRW